MSRFKKWWETVDHPEFDTPEFKLVAKAWAKLGWRESEARFNKLQKENQELKRKLKAMREIVGEHLNMEVVDNLVHEEIKRVRNEWIV